jgi:uncharacterized protein YkwD
MRIVSLLTALALAGALTSCGGGGGAAPQPGPPSGNPATMLASLNSLRTANGSQTLSSNAQLAAVAQAQANYNATQHANLATNGSGQTLEQRAIAAGVNVVDWAAPIAGGNDVEAIDRWTNTQKERDLLYSKNFNAIGIGMAIDGTLQRWVVLLAEVGP